MSTAIALIKRNTKLFFKDKGMFFTSLITPGILLLLYITFLGNVYRDSYTMNLPEGMQLPENLLDGLVSGQLISSILSVSCVTVAFCSNLLMVQDKANGTVKDIRIAPVRPALLSACYYIGTLFSTLLIGFTATGICLVYAACTGWYMRVADVLLLFADVALLVLFGTALSSVINFFLSTNGQMSAVGTLVSSCYGFICGAYMPISTFSPGLQKVLYLLPGTYGTTLVRTHCLQGALNEMKSLGFPAETIQQFKSVLDCAPRLMDKPVSIGAMYGIMGSAILLLVSAYILMNTLKKKP